MPIRHKEGRVTGRIERSQIVFKYQKDVNGSLEYTAALTNKDGNVLGIMPHPEAAIQSFLLPDQKEKSEYNFKIFKNAVEYAKRTRQ